MIGVSRAVQPPANNMGAQNTKLTSLLDWLSFTLPVEEVQIISDFLKIPITDFVKMPHGAHGYRSQITSGNIAILSDGSPGMGCHVVMSGQGCRQYEAMQGNDWSDLVKRVREQQGHFTRIDLALDDKAGLLSMRQIQEAIDKRHIVSRFKSGRTISEHKFSGEAGTSAGQTIYLGSPQSQMQVRIYDKAQEQGAEGHWIRVELECRKERAEVMAQYIQSGEYLGYLAAATLNNYIHFVEPAEDTNKARWPLAQWWSTFLGNVEKLKLTIAKGVKTIEQTKEWFRRQIGPTYAMIMKAEGGCYDFFDEVLREGAQRLKPRHFVMIDNIT